ncbi:hypothetical protein EJ05DRAFT_46531 [Pseudovirgaria hyperparasitica]|uniref:F-box domain-containing protein n=1 Tax=Pseudovirgaria hyperparasitica TaxID=470096 RepID=A0A6A6W5P9_9PEZI|nr:uncharacterized protein EJ05DRAFT_46531 [Pseudovirgaria hyperparasitica]KAF2756887.1 hypothetical protein EJ05DRAFT_46531 [Pseudovirgaria hyperparasitica]
MALSPSYLRLPCELHLLIADALPLTSRCLLRKTCRHMRSVIPDPILSTRLNILPLIYTGPFLQPTQFALEHNILACTSCERIRGLDRFPCSVKLGKEFPRTGEGKIDGAVLDKCWTSKKCVDCMVVSEKVSRNMRGRWVWLGLEKHVFCHECGELGILDPGEGVETWGFCGQRDLRCWECSSRGPDMAE